MFKYIHKNIPHTETNYQYMINLGMDDDQIESVYRQRDFELQQHQEIAKNTRDAAIGANINIAGHAFQVGPKARDNINEAINKCQRDELPDSETRNWILADNAVAAVTFANLKDVMNAYAARMDVIYQDYATWRAGDKKEPFST